MPVAYAYRPRRPQGIPLRPQGTPHRPAAQR
jgi:hypothetical protein